MVTFPHGQTLFRELGGEGSAVTKHFVEGQAHVLGAEMREETNAWIEELVARAEELNGSVEDVK